jgi:ubiquinol-cytochrome c reductase cytochrome c subunit
VKSRLRSRLSSYGVLALALVMCGGLYSAVASASSAPAVVDDPQQSLAVKEGRQLYLTGCSTCHGVDLQGGDGGPSLVGVGAASVVFQVESGRMPLVAGQVQAPRKEAKYTTEQIDQMAAFIQANGGGPELPEQTELSDIGDGQLALGGDLFRTNCASCHNSAGSGGALSQGKYAPALRPASADVIYAAMLSGPESMPRFGDNQLTPEEKQAITSYVRYVTQAANPGGNDLGKFGPVPEGLVAWLVGIGLLVLLTLWIGARA